MTDFEHRSKTAFGAKLTVSSVDGYVEVITLSIPRSILRILFDNTRYYLE